MQGEHYMIRLSEGPHASIDSAVNANNEQICIPQSKGKSPNAFDAHSAWITSKVRIKILNL